MAGWRVATHWRRVVQECGQDGRLRPKLQSSVLSEDIPSAGDVPTGPEQESQRGWRAEVTAHALAWLAARRLGRGTGGRLSLHRPGRVLPPAARA